jgi:hypothetical protein
MLVENGRRLLISNLDLAPFTQVRGSLWTPAGGPTEGLYSLSAVEFFRLFPDADEFKLSTAVRMNASAPYVSPVCRLPTEPAYRVVDAAYYDDFGVDLAASWILENREWAAQNTSGVVLLQIRDRVIARDRFGPAPGLAGHLRPSGWWERRLAGLTTPLAGSSDARRAAMLFRNDQQLQTVSSLLNRDRPGADLFTTAVIECLVPAEMSWSLTETEIAAIRGGGAAQVSDRILQLFERDPEALEVRRRNEAHLQGIQTLLQAR